jgi:hypothetical protein
VFFNQSPLHAVFLLIILTIINGLFFPILSVFFEPLTWRDLSGYNEVVSFEVQLDYLIFGIGLLLSYLFFNKLIISNKASKVITSLPRPSKISRDDFIFFGLASAGLAIYAIYISNIGLDVVTSTETFTEKYLLSRGLGFYSFGINLVILACFFGEESDRRLIKFFSRSLALCVIIWSLGFIYIRTYAVILIIGYLYLFLRYKNINIKDIRIKPLLITLILWIFIELFSFYRGVIKSNQDFSNINLYELSEQNYEKFIGATVGGSEFSHNFITAFELRRDVEDNFLLGSSYLESLLILIPKGIFPDRPETLPEWFARTYYPVFYEKGGGTAFSIVGEAWLNFGPFFGAFIVSFIIGLSLSWMEWKVRVRPGSIVARVSPYVIFLTLILHRAAWAATIKQIFMAIIPIAILVFVFKILANKR